VAHTSFFKVLGESLLVLSLKVSPGAKTGVMREECRQCVAQQRIEKGKILVEEIGFP